MPYEVTSTMQPSAPDHFGAESISSARQPHHRVALWAHRSLPRKGFVWFIGGTAALISLPLITLIGSPVLWGLLPFLVLAVVGIWWALQRNHADRDIVEHLTIWADSITLTRLGPRGKRADWSANPYWVTPVLHAKGGPVPNYVTLRGSDREVELGAFLSEDERIALFADVEAMLLHQRNPHQTGGL